MKKLWHQRPWLSLALATLLVIAMSLSGWLPVNRLARTLVSPVGGIFSGIGRPIGNWLSEFGNVGGLNQANQELREANERLNQQLAEFTQIQAENAQLRAQLNFGRRHQLKGVGADIINYQPDSVRSFIRVNRGGRHGVKMGQPVVAGGALVGAVSRVEPSTSEVMLITDADFRVLARTLSAQAPGLVKGRPPEGLTMERIPRNRKLNSGEVVLTSGLDGQFPAGLRIGVIQGVETTQEAIFQNAFIQPAADLLNLSAVTILDVNKP